MCQRTTPAPDAHIRRGPWWAGLALGCAGLLPGIAACAGELSAAPPRLVYELGAAPDGRPYGSRAAPQGRWALEFKGSTRERMALPSGFLRVQLSGDSTLQLRPRGGGFGVIYRTRF